MSSSQTEVSPTRQPQSPAINLASPFAPHSESRMRTPTGGGRDKQRDREVGSVTISLRPRRAAAGGDDEAVEEEEDDDEDDIGEALDQVPSKPSISSHRTPRKHSTAYRPPRPRSNSLLLPSHPATSSGSDFFLPHYSTDSKFSLQRDQPSPEFGVRLGTSNRNYDSTLGDAIRKGASGGGEVALPPSALRVLSEAKEDMDNCAMSKQTRKGSIGMGLFKESRSQGRKATDRKSSQERKGSGIVASEDQSTPLADVMEEEVFPIQRRQSKSERRRPSVKAGPLIDDESAVIVTSPEKSKSGLGEEAEFDDDSGWSTTSSTTDSFVIGSDTEESDEDPLAVPLQPYGHKVGGHSSIYQFTRAAICKPLVGRENIFYEDIEHLAPALLPYTPRYLGVMLVNYRRLPRTEGSQTPSAERDMALSPSTTQPSTPANPYDRGDQGVPDVEVPEVMLDSNRHVVPEWLFESTGAQDRGRGRSQRFPSADESDRGLGPARSPGSYPRDSISPSSSFGRLSMASPGDSANHMPMHRLLRDEPTTPAHSPASPMLHHTHSSPALQRMGLLSNAEGSSSGLASPHPPFGGIGSTTVNNKLKDHVFSKVLKRLKRRTGHLRQPDEDADDEQEQDATTSRRPPLSTLPSSDGSVRRTRSEVVVGNEARKSKKRDDSSDRGLFSMDDDDAAPIRTRRASRPASEVIHERAGSESPAQLLSPGDNQSMLNSTDDIARTELFIFMEDLTGRLKKPCVLDLKMGTRQYGFDATPLKKISQRKKCDQTTSRTLGVRMCGMQVWDTVAQEFVSRNKYRGRQLKTDDFPRVLSLFLNDGNQLLLEHVPPLLQKLYNMAAILATLDGFRFYGCSLLLIYDGDRETQDKYARQTWFKLGHERSESLFNKPRRTSLPTSRRSRSADVPDKSKTTKTPRVRGEVTVRIVDFAHSTSGQDIEYPYPKGVTDPPGLGKGYYPMFDETTGLALARFPPQHPRDPDLGFIFGISSIVMSLRSIYTAEVETRRQTGLATPPLPAFEHGDVFDTLFPPSFDSGYLST